MALAAASAIPMPDDMLESLCAVSSAAAAVLGVSTSGSLTGALSAACS